MIELERDTEDPHFPGEVWASHDHMHVIVQETESTVRRGSEPGWYVRDTNGERGPYDAFDQAFAAAQKAWGEVSLAPANRLARNLAEGREHAVADYLLEYLAEYGAVGIDVQALAQLVMTRQEGA